MGADSFFDNNFDSDTARYERQNRLNPPEFAPGQGDDDLFKSDFEQPVGNGGFDAFSNSSQDLFSSSTPMAGQFNMGSSQNFLGQTQTQEQPKSDEDKIFDALVKGGKGTVSFLSDLSSSFKGLTPKFYSVYGKNTTIVGLSVSALGFVLRLFGIKFGVQLLVGGLLSSAFGVILLMFNVENGKKCSSQYSEDNKEQNFSEPPSSFEPQFSDDFGGDSDFDFNSDFSDNDDDEYSFDFGDDEDEDDDVDFGFGDDDFDFDNEDDVQDGEDVDSVLDTLPEMDRGMYTRQFLYDSLVRVLPNLKANFSSVKTYDEDSDVFLYWDDIIQRASSVVGLKDDDIPYLKSLEENLFTIKAVINRTPKMKSELIGSEVAKAYAYNEYDNDEDRAKVFSRVETVLDECIITIFTGASHFISLKDMYNKCSDYILDSKNSIPVVLGVNEKGEVIKADFKKIESMIIAGMPRSGKSWLVQAILFQMCALLPPSELNIFFLDPKAKTSDYWRFKLPHVKKFASKYTDSNGLVVNSNYDSILDVLRWIVNVEAPRRKKIIGDHGKVNINDFKLSHPEVRLPIIYIVIDEMVTLSEMAKEDESEYQSYLSMIVTQFPNLGIKGIFVPHEVKNQIINKTAYDSIKARISVKGSPSHIESSTGTKPKEFSYKLANVGDMAVNVDSISVSTMFVHGVALTDSNDKNIELFNYLRRFWFKYAEDEFDDSVAKGVDDDKKNDLLLERVNDDLDLFDEPVFDESADSSKDAEVFSNSNEEGLSGMDVEEGLNEDDDFLRDFM